MIWKVVKELNIICKMTGLTCTMQPNELEDCLLHAQSLIRRYTELNHVKQPAYPLYNSWYYNMWEFVRVYTTEI